MPATERELPTILVAAPAPRFGLPEVYAVIAALSFAVARFVPVLDLGMECVLRRYAGIPCATCGMTHAFVLLAHGHVLEALQWSPLGTLLAAGAWSFAVADLVRVALGRPLPVIRPGVLRRLVLAGAAALLVNWAFLLIHGVGP